MIVGASTLLLQRLLRNTITPNPSPSKPTARTGAAMPNDGQPLSVAGAATKAPAFPPGTRVVVAEDDRVSQAVLTLILQKLGLEVHVAVNGLIAVELVRELRPDFVMMDMQMPEMDGTEAIRTLRTDLGGPQPPVIVLSANVLSEQRIADLKALGVCDFLIKPVNRARLFASLARLAPKA